MGRAEWLVRCSLGRSGERLGEPLVVVVVVVDSSRKRLSE